MTHARFSQQLPIHLQDLAHLHASISSPGSFASSLIPSPVQAVPQLPTSGSPSASGNSPLRPTQSLHMAIKEESMAVRTELQVRRN